MFDLVLEAKCNLGDLNGRKGRCNSFTVGDWNYCRMLDGSDLMVRRNLYGAASGRGSGGCLCRRSY